MNKLEFDDLINEYQNEICGEYYTIKTLLLVMSSKFVKNKKAISFHTLLNSESGAGKDFILQKVMGALPRSDFHSYTRISARALDYLDPKEVYNSGCLTWDNKFLGLQDIEAEILNASTLKVFLSDGSQTAIVLDGKVVETKHKGSPIILMTSAYSNPNKELMRRVNILNLDESDTQTRNILRLQAKRFGVQDIDYEVIRGHFSSLKQYTVFIPYALKMADLISANGTHMRTFFNKFLDFIKASAVFSQSERDVKHGILQANLLDYEVAKDIFINLSLTIKMNPLSRDKKEQLELLTAEFEGDWFSTKQAMAVFSITYKATRLIIKYLQENGFLAVERRADEFSNRPVSYYKPKEPEQIKFPTTEELYNEC